MNYREMSLYINKGDLINETDIVTNISISYVDSDKGNRFFLNTN